jgi:plasmid stabilization system protein ParE
MRARYTDAARDDTDDILAHIAKRQFSRCWRVAAIIETTVARLIAFPQLGSQTDVTGVRVTITRPHPYLVFHRG